jgi:hypothetical protein
MTKHHVCPVCGYPGLSQEPWGPQGDQPSWDICPSCGIEFGYEDSHIDPVKRHTRHLELRQAWIDRGRTWWSQSPFHPTPSELGWDPSDTV